MNSLNLNKGVLLDFLLFFVQFALPMAVQMWRCPVTTRQEQALHRQHERAMKGVRADPGNHLLQSVLFNTFIK